MSVPALTINKVFLSGMNAIAMADQLIRAGECDVVVAGGQESMTNAPHLLEKSREGHKYGDVTMRDHMAFDGLWDAFTDQAMGLLTEQADTADQEFTREQRGRVLGAQPASSPRAPGRTACSTTRSSPCRSRSARATPSSSRPTAYRLHQAVLPEAAKSNIFHLFFAVAGGIVIGTGGLWLFNPPATELVDNVIRLPRYGQLYLSSLFMLIAVFFMAWRLEMFWRALAHKDRWQYKSLVIGFFLACGSLFWCSSYRLLYRQLNGEHQSLLAALLLIAWLFISYAVVRYRLLNRKLFVSRKVIYSAAAPIAFAGYLILLGLASLLMRAFGWSLPFIFQWLLIVMGLLFVVVLVFSGKVRATVKYFISTHFYVNKYEYRDEWLAFSSLLQGTLTEREVVDALHRILSKSLYTRRILIWLGDVQEGFRLTDVDKDQDRSAYAVIASDDPLVSYLQSEHVFIFRNARKCTGPTTCYF